MLIFKRMGISAALLVTTLLAKPILITEDEPVRLSVTDSRPVTVKTNFLIKDAKFIISDTDNAKLELLPKGFIVVPLKRNYNATVVLNASNGALYTVDVDSGGRQSVFNLEDPLQSYKTDAKYNFETLRIDQDARNIVKAMLLDKPISGFEKYNSYMKVNGNGFDLERLERYNGGKYVVDRWAITNVSNEGLYFTESDFYTQGILAIALEKYKLKPNESMYMINIYNKHAIYKAEGGRK